MPKAHAFEPLRRPQFRRIFAGQVVSGIGDWFDYVALLTLIAFVWKSGAFALAALTIAMAVPWIVVGPIAGVWADRLPARTLMIGADLLRALFVVCYLFAGSLPVLLLLVMCKSAVSTLFLPAKNKAIRQSSSGDDLSAAVALSTFTGEATKVIGPAIGGVLVAMVGPRWAFGVDAATFVLSAVILIGLTLPRTQEPARSQSQGFRAELREGLSFLWQSPALRMALTGMTATVFLVFTFDTLSPLTLAALGIPQSMLGFAIAGIGFGAVLGSLVIGQWGTRLPDSLLMSGCQMVAGTLVALVGFAAVTHVHVPKLVWLAGMILTGVAATGIIMSFSLALQRGTPEPLLGRVSSSAEVMPTVMQLIAPPIGAAVASAFGVGWVLALAGAFLAVLGLVTVAPSWRSAGGLWAARDLDVVAHMSSPHPAKLGMPPSGQQAFFL